MKHNLGTASLILLKSKLALSGVAVLLALAFGLLLLSGLPVQAQDKAIEYAENGTDPVATFTADDPEGATSITWSLATDTTIDGVESADIVDNASFEIDDEGVLEFIDPPDFENPATTNATANTYKVVVLATDAATGGQTGYYKVTVNVTNVEEPGNVTLATGTTNESPQYLVGATLTATAEDGDITATTQTFTADVAGEVAGVTWRWYRDGTMITDADAQDNTYTLVQADAGKNIRAVVYYVVTGNTDQDTAAKTTDYPVLAARVGANRLTFDPETVSRTISEGDAGRNVGAPVTATGNHGTIRYGLADSGDGTTAAPKFKIDPVTGQITTEADLNYEAAAGDADNCVVQNACVVTVTATDSTGEAATTPATVNIAITNVDEKPTFPTEALMMLSSPEDREALFDTTDGPVTTEAGVTYAATDPEGRNITYRLMGPDASKFQLSASRVLSFKEEPDYEMPGDANRDKVYEVTVRANDGTLTADRMVKITVTDEDEGPIVTGLDTINYAENGTGVVGTFMARDPEGGSTINWYVVDPTGNAIDGVNPSTLSVDNQDFRIDQKGMLTFAETPDFENPADANTDNTYLVVVGAGDNATLSEAELGYHAVTVKVTNLNEPGKITMTTDTTGGTPQYLVGATLTATAEDGDITSTTQTFTTDVPGEVTAVTWRWYSGGSVIAGANTNSYQLQDSDANKRIRVEVRYLVDGNTNQESAQLTTDYPVLPVRTGANQLEFAPATVSRTITEGDEGRNVGAPVTATGNHGTIRYTLAGTDGDEFDIDDKTGQITTAVDLNFEAAGGSDNQCATANECEVTITATDSTGVTGITATVEIEITSVDEKPMFTDTAGTARSPELITSPENRAALSAAGSEADVTYAATDPEGLNVNLTLMGPDVGKFSLSNTGVLSFVKAPDREMPGDANKDNVYELTVRASDGTLTADRMVKVTVSNVDEAPVVTAGAVTGLRISGPASRSYAENGTGAIATYTASGPNAASARWTLEGADAGDFTLSAATGASTMLRFRSSPNYEAPADANTDNVYMVTVKATEGSDMDTQDVTVTVTDVEEQGTGDALVDRYDSNTNGEIEKSEVITAINDYFDDGANAPSKADVIRLINLYLDS